MRDITYCISRYCDCKGTCGRHCDNNDLKGKIYSASDFTDKNETKCEFYIEDYANKQSFEDNKVYRCEHCGSKMTNTIQVGQFGLKYIHCNSCGKDSYNGELGEITLTKDNVNYPQHYYSFANGKSIDNDKINEWVRECVMKLESNPDQEYAFIGTGNTMVFVFDLDDAYEVYVCKNYDETTVDKSENV